MAQVGNAATIGSAEIRTDYPVEEGLTAGTQKQTGMEMALVAEEGSIVREIDKTGIY